MDYLCLAVQRKVTKNESGSREQAQEYFWEKFGDCVKAKLEAEKKKLERRIRYYERKAEKHEEVKEEYLRRREGAREELAYVENQLRSEGERFLAWNYEEKYEPCLEIPDRLDFGQDVLMLRMAKICRIGSRFQVVEETYSYMVWRAAGDKGALEVRKRIPEDEAKRWTYLAICREEQETAQGFQRKIKRMGTEARRRFHAEKNRGIF